MFNLTADPPFPLRYNIAPTQSAPVIRTNPETRRREAALMRWGLVPHWAKDLKIGNRLINARVETAAEKPSFRAAWKSRRALIPASAFYEWKREENKKTPYCIHRPDFAPFAFAGLWSIWRPPPPEAGLAELPDARLLGLSDHGDLLSFTIITTAPRGVMRGLHDRMPLILAPEHYDRWLDPRELSPEETDPLLAPDDFVAYPVSSFVNRPQNDGPACVQPVGRMIE